MEVPHRTCMWIRLSSLFKIYMVVFNFISLNLFLYWFIKYQVYKFQVICVLYHNWCCMEWKVMPFLYKSTGSIQQFLLLMLSWNWNSWYLVMIKDLYYIYIHAICVEETKFWTHIPIILQVSLLSYCEIYMKMIV